MLPKGEHNFEFRPPPEVAFHMNRAAVRGHDPMNHGQTEAGSLADALCREERGKNLFLDLLLHTNSCVFDDQGHTLFPRGGADGELSSLWVDLEPNGSAALGRSRGLRRIILVVILQPDLDGIAAEESEQFLGDFLLKIRSQKPLIR